MIIIKLLVHTFCANGFALNHDKSLQVSFFCVKRQAKNDFLKDVAFESTVTPGSCALIYVNEYYISKMGFSL